MGQSSVRAAIHRQLLTQGGAGATEGRVLNSQAHISGHTEKSPTAASCFVKASCFCPAVHRFLRGWSLFCSRWLPMRKYSLLISLTLCGVCCSRNRNTYYSSFKWSYFKQFVLVWSFWRIHSFSRCCFTWVNQRVAVFPNALIYNVYFFSFLFLLSLFLSCLFFCSFCLSYSQARNRTYLLCSICKKTQWSLPVHLRRSCMKDSPGVDIERAVDAAKKEANELLRRGRVWEYGLIRKILDNPDPVGRYDADCFTLLALCSFHFTRWPGFFFYSEKLNFHLFLF